MSEWTVENLFKELFEESIIENKLKQYDDRAKELDKKNNESIKFLSENENRVHLFMTDREFYRCKQSDGSDVDPENSICDPLKNIQNCIEIFENLPPLLTTTNTLMHDDLDEVISLSKLLDKGAYLDKLETQQVKLRQMFQNILDSANEEDD